MRGCLGAKSFAAGALRAILRDFFRALASIDIARLSKKTVPCAEEIAKFVQAGDDKVLEFWREMAEI